MARCERWKELPDFGGRYEVSSRGRVRTVEREVVYKTGGRRTLLSRVLKQHGNRGYRQVSLKRQRKRQAYMVHRLVMLTFVGPRPKGKEVRHRDGNRANNLLKNLRYGTRLDNMIDRDLHGNTAHGSKHGRAKLTEKDVLQLRKAFQKGGVTQAFLAKRYGVSPTTVRKIVTRQLWTHI